MRFLARNYVLNDESEDINVVLWCIDRHKEGRKVVPKAKSKKFRLVYMKSVKF